MQNRLNEITKRINKAAEEDGRSSDAVVLVAVSKKQPDDRISQALDLGIRVFGENRIQEAETRWQHRRGQYDDLKLHLIGALQSNKAAQAVALFDTIEVLDREKLAAALAEQEKKQQIKREYFVQVNTGNEPQKAGIAPIEAAAFTLHCRENHGLNVTGLMAIPPIDEEAAIHFALLNKIAYEAGARNLSMGMSRDYETAIRMGATHIRIGSALFGERIAQCD